MATGELTVLDVGHGNCSVIRDGETVYVVDVPERPRELTQMLYERNLDVDTILISHADEDHVAGVPDLLCDDAFRPRRVYVNPDGIKKTRAWKAMRLAMRDLEKRAPDFEQRLALNRTTTEELALPSLELDVLAPATHTAAAGVGGRTLSGRTLTSNSMSAVLRVKAPGGRGVLLAGDIDDVGLQEMIDDEIPMDAEVLVFPHHGGNPGKADPGRFATKLLAHVNPDAVAISHSRTSGGTPRREIIDAIRARGAEVHVACTQLSTQCAKDPPDVEQSYLSTLPARGRATASCCAGSLEFTLDEKGVTSPQLPGHRNWVSENVSGRMCLPMHPEASEVEVVRVSE
jgi:beta-lactamase superfamily II metal-dependent hydrolase